MSTHGAQIRIASEADALGLAALKLHWSRPNDHDFQVDAEQAAAFAASLGDWMGARGEHSLCVIALIDGDVIGMAWLAIFHRAPNVGDLDRLSGDVQSVFVVPAHRGRGIGQAMMLEIIDRADARGVRRITVSSSSRARPVYERVGFRIPTRLLEREFGGGEPS